MLFRELDKAKLLGYVGWHEGPTSPPAARQEATFHAKGDLLFFFDNHVVVEPNYFKRALLQFEKYGSEMDMLHSTTCFYPGESPQYHYRLQLAKNFWASAAMLPVDSHKPYRIAAGGHGGFVVRRSVWEEVGGYGDIPFVGYGGEEIYFDMKMAMLDKTNWIEPRMIHWHFPGDKGYQRHQSPDYYRNMMMCANIIGGPEWMMKVYQSFSKLVGEPKHDPFLDKYPTMKHRIDMYQFMQEAEERSREHAKAFWSVRKRNLEEQIEFFKANQIVFD